MRVPRKHVMGAVGAIALTAGAMAVAPTSALAAPSPGASVVINEVYGGGGNAGAAFNRDFIELVNKTTAAVDLSSWSVQYASAAGTSWSTKTNLTGSIPAGGRIVVGGASGANGAAITADVDGAINLSGSAGKVALVNNQTALPGTTCTDACSDLPQVVDFVGYGTANDWAGAAAAPGTPTRPRCRATAPAPTRPTTRPTSPPAPPPPGPAPHRRPAPRSPRPSPRSRAPARRPRSSARTSSSRASSPRPTRPVASTASTCRRRAPAPSRAPAAPRTASSSSRPSRPPPSTPTPSSATTSRSPARSASSAA